MGIHERISSENAWNMGTPLDVFHGVDAFFEQGRRRVTLDVTMREKEIAKADVIMHVGMDDDGRIVIDPAEMQRVAEAVATGLTQH